MNIAIFSDNFYPELSGISDVIIELAKEFAKRGHHVNFYVPRYSSSDYATSRVPRAELELGERIRITRFSSVPLHAPTGQGRLVIPSLWRWHTIKQFRPDVIHSHLFGGVGIEALIASRVLRVPLIGTNHTVLSEFLRYSPLKAQWFLGLILHYVNWYYNHAALLTAPSEFLLREMKATGFHGASHVVPNPIDLEFFRPIPEKRTSFRKEFSFNECAVVYAGRFAEEKRIEVLLDAIAIATRAIPSITFALAGHGAAEKSLRERAVRLGIGKNVKFLGTLSKDALVRLYNAGDISASASTSEVQSMTVLQAMACGLPTVGVSAAGLAEHINARNGFLAEPNDPKAIAEKIIVLARDPALRAKLGAGGRTSAEQFSVSAIASQWEEIYADVIRRSR